MTVREVAEEQLSRFSEVVAERLGLHFPHNRRDQLRQCLGAVRRAFELEDDAACMEWLLSARLTAAQVQVLASQLTVGETYFLREPAAFEALGDTILPQLIAERRDHDHRLRLLSAGCCTGEEAYSLAMMMHQRWPELRSWDVQIIGADLNRVFLEKACAGVYKEWSFRNAPHGFKEQFFTHTADGHYSVVPAIRKMVSFTPLNLVDDEYPVAAIHDMDVIFCRNVLMYFTPTQLRNVIVKLHRTLRDDGWLVVSPTEASTALFGQFATVNLAGAILFQRTRRAAAQSCSGTSSFRPVAFPRTPPHAHSVQSAHSRPRLVTCPGAQASATQTIEPRETSTADETMSRAESLFAQARYAHAAELLQAVCEVRPADGRGLALLVRALANLGNLVDAEAWCGRWILSDKLNPTARYLRAVVLMEADRRDEARAALQHALYLDPQCVLAHFALGNLARREDRPKDAARHYDTALDLLRNYEPTAVLPESDGLAAGEIVQLITSIATTKSIR